MRVLMRWIDPGGRTEYGNGRNTFESERAAVLLAGYRIVPAAELSIGEQAQAGSASSGMAEAVVIETLADAPYVHRGFAGSVRAGSRYALGVTIEPDRGEE